MFQKLVSNLSFSPGVGTQLAYYLRRLKKEQITRRLSAMAAVVAILFQIMTLASAPTASNASGGSSNDIVYGGLQSGDPRGEILNIWNGDTDANGHFGFRALFDRFGIGYNELSNTHLTSINSSDSNLLSLGRNHSFSVDTAITVTGGTPPSNNPYPCDHPLISHGASGNCVKHLQWYLVNKFNYADRINPYGGIDGIFGDHTFDAVQHFQYDHQVANSGCPSNCDGIVGSATWSRLHGPGDIAQSNTQTYYQRPLNVWDTDGHSNTYQVLAGTRRDGSTFYVMLACGNIVVLKSAPPPPPPTVVPTPTRIPTPIPTPTPKLSPSPSPSRIPTPIPTPTLSPSPQVLVTPSPSPSPTPRPTPSPSPSSSPTPPIIPPLTPPTPLLSKTATYLNRNGADGKPLDANGTTAEAGDSVRYTLITANNGDTAVNSYQPVEHINDILEYADVVDLGGATQANGVLTWPAQAISAHSRITNSFVVRIKSPIPATPQSISDPLSFDLRIDNVYGNEVHIRIAAPPVKQIEAASQTLPQTGPVGSILTFAFLLMVLYFYLRNRQLVQEIQILKVDHNNPGV